MPKTFQNKVINRILDANINRAKEGLRVCEELARFFLNSRCLTLEFKKIRHELDPLIKCLPQRRELLKVRSSLQDVGRTIHLGELKRKDFADIFFANIQRVKESVRVLEEFSKLSHKNLALGFKKIRYEIYEIEKKTCLKLR